MGEARLGKIDPAMFTHRQKSRRKTIITLRMLKDHLILSNYHIKLAVGDDSQFIYIHSLFCIHVAVYL